jgi:hypothetical protein
MKEPKFPAPTKTSPLFSEGGLFSKILDMDREQKERAVLNQIADYMGISVDNDDYYQLALAFATQQFPSEEQNNPEEVAGKDEETTQWTLFAKYMLVGEVARLRDERHRSILNACEILAKQSPWKTFVTLYAIKDSDHPHKRRGKSMFNKYYELPQPIRTTAKYDYEFCRDRGRMAEWNANVSSLLD